jgi:ribosomal protein L2
MGKRIISQNRGKGTPTYRAPSHKFKAKLKHIKVTILPGLHLLPGSAWKTRKNA